LRIEFHINEGNLYKVGSVAFTNTPGGNMLFSADELGRGLKAQHSRSGRKTKIGEHGLEADTGLVFTPKKLADDIEAAEDFYGAKGYIDVKQNGPNLRVIKVPNTETGTMDLQTRLTPAKNRTLKKLKSRAMSKPRTR
jgi:outer membrane protein assembly factor BamA